MSRERLCLYWRNNWLLQWLCIFIQHNGLGTPINILCVRIVIFVFMKNYLIFVACLYGFLGLLCVHIFLPFAI